MANPYSPPESVPDGKREGARTRFLWLVRVRCGTQEGMLYCVMALMCMLTAFIYVLSSVIYFFERFLPTLQQDPKPYSPPLLFAVAAIFFAGAILGLLSTRCWWREQIRLAIVLTVILGLLSAFVVRVID